MVIDILNKMASFADDPISRGVPIHGSALPPRQFYKGFEIVESYFASNPFRDKWNHQREYVLSCIGFAIGFINIWQFPQVVYKHGNIAFLIPYVLTMLVIAYPILYLETLLGQFSGSNQFGAFNFAPVCKGIGISVLFLQFYICIFYIGYLTYAIKFMTYSFSALLPWTECNETWGANETCYLRTSKNREKTDSCSTIRNCAVCVGKQTAAEQFWLRSILHLEDGDHRYGVEDVGPVEWDLFGYLLLSWFLEYFFIIKGIRSAGKVVYLTATFPLVMLLVLFIYAMTLKGASTGVKFLFEPDWSKLEEAETWYMALTHVLFSIGLGAGTYILYSSYSSFEFKLERYTFLIIFMDFLASVLATLMMFAFLGYLADLLKCHVNQILSGDPNLLFVLIPEILATLPASQLWCLLYFLMIYVAGFDSLGIFIDTVLTTIAEEFPKLRRHRACVRITGCLALFLLGISCVTYGGFEVVAFIDLFATEFPLIFIVASEITAVVFVYGWQKFSADVGFMMGYEVNGYWKTCWALILPVMLSILFVFSAVDAYKICDNYSRNVCIGGWFITASCLLPVPITATVYLWKYWDTPYTWKGAFQPTHNWGPRDVLTKIAYLDWLNKKGKTVTTTVRTTLAELEKEVTEEAPTVKEVAMQRVAKRKMSVFHRFSGEFHSDEIRRLEARVENAV